MGSLMQCAETASKEKGADFSLLVPASVPLFGYYQKHGYGCKVFHRYVEWLWDEAEKMTAAAGDVAAFFPVEGAALQRLRTKHAPLPRVQLAPQSFAVVAEDLAEDGYGLVVLPRGYAVYGCESQLENTDEVAVPELFAEDEAVAKTLLAAVAVRCGAAKLRVSLAGESPLFTGKGERRPYALYKSFDENAAVMPENVYFQFGLG